MFFELWYSNLDFEPHSRDNGSSNPFESSLCHLWASPFPFWPVSRTRLHNSGCQLCMWMSFSLLASSAWNSTVLYCTGLCCTTAQTSLKNLALTVHWSTIFAHHQSHPSTTCRITLRRVKRERFGECCINLNTDPYAYSLVQKRIRRILDGCSQVMYDPAFPNGLLRMPTLGRARNNTRVLLRSMLTNEPVFAHSSRQLRKNGFLRQSFDARRSIRAL